MPNEYDLSAAFAAIERELTASMMRNLARHRAEETAEGIQWAAWQAEQLDALETYRRRNQKQFGPRFRELNGQIEDLLRETHARGGLEQEEEILKAIREGASGRKLPGGLSGSFFRTNERKLNALIKATTSDMQQAETAVLRAANDQYRKIIYNAQVYANTGAGTYEKAVDMATKDFLSRGIQCVRYSNGARHTLTDYADMAIRTASKRAYLQGEGAKRQEWGVSTVILNKRGNPCPLCRPFCGKVFIDDVWSGGKRSDGKWPLLSEAIAQGLYHPRCKDSHTTWFPELEEETPLTEAEERRQEAEYEQQQKVTGAERQGEKYRRLEAYCLDSDNRKKYAQRARMWEKQVENTGVSGIMKITPMRKLAVGRSAVLNPMSRERYLRMREGLKKQGITVIANAAGDDLRYLLWQQAEAMAQSATQMMHIGEVPSASAFFEEIIHMTQYRKYGGVDAGDFLERAAREVAANRKLLANKDAYGFDEMDTSEIHNKLKTWEEDFIRRAGVSYDESEFNRDV